MSITTYTVTHRGNCVFITGSVPARSLEVLIDLVPENSVADPNAARMYGATFAFGPEAELKQLRVSQAPAVEQQIKATHPGVSKDATKWLASGERGMSSEAMFTHLTGVKCGDDWGFDSIPYDPSDFRRCQLLLEQVPELHPIFPRMAEVSPKWAALVQAWPNIVKAMDEEVPEWREGRSGKSCPTAYQLIKQAIGR